MIRASAKKLALKYGIALPNDWDEQGIDLRILPQGKAPVIVSELAHGKNRPVLKWMQFALLPRWSKTRRVKFATHNARLESETKSEKGEPKSPQWIFEKPTWRTAFQRRHCLIPMTDFIEPIYTGPHAGHMVKFFAKTYSKAQKESDGSEILTAAGIWEEWVGKEGEVVDSFAILTDDPIPFVKKVGHDRSPVFLAEAAFDPWLNEQISPEVSPHQIVEFLRKNRAVPPLEVEDDRDLKPGWEKRI